MTGCFAHIRSRRLGELSFQGMRVAIRLSVSDPGRLALSIAGQVMQRVMRDVRKLGLVVTTSDGRVAPEGAMLLVEGSDVHRAALVLAEWAKTGRGNAAEINVLIVQVRADVEGIDTSEAPLRTLDPATVHGAVLLAAGARLAVVEGRTVTALELAVLASMDEHTVRMAVKAGTLRPLSSRRPMRFAADVAREYLYTHSVLGFGAPTAA